MTGKKQRSAGDPTPPRAQALATAHCRKRSTPRNAEKILPSHGGKRQNHRSCGWHSKGAPLFFLGGRQGRRAGWACPSERWEFRRERKKPSTSCKTLFYKFQKKAVAQRTANRDPRATRKAAVRAGCWAHRCIFSLRLQGPRGGKQPDGWRVLLAAGTLHRFRSTLKSTLPYKRHRRTLELHFYEFLVSWWVSLRVFACVECLLQYLCVLSAH